MDDSILNVISVIRGLPIQINFWFPPGRFSNAVDDIINILQNLVRTSPKSTVASGKNFNVPTYPFINDDLSHSGGNLVRQSICPDPFGKVNCFHQNILHSYSWSMMSISILSNGLSTLYCYVVQFSQHKLRIFDQSWTVYLKLTWKNLPRFFLGSSLLRDMSNCCHEVAQAYENYPDLGLSLIYNCLF